jgi:hypothetical protein
MQADPPTSTAGGVLHEAAAAGAPEEQQQQQPGGSAAASRAGSGAHAGSAQPAQQAQQEPGHRLHRAQLQLDAVVAGSHSAATSPRTVNGRPEASGSGAPGEASPRPNLAQEQPPVGFGSPMNSGEASLPGSSGAASPQASLFPTASSSGSQPGQPGGTPGGAASMQQHQQQLGPQTSLPAGEEALMREERRASSSGAGGFEEPAAAGDGAWSAPDHKCALLHDSSDAVLLQGAQEPCAVLLSQGHSLMRRAVVCRGSHHAAV